MSKPRTFKEIPIYVTEDHNDVLPHIFRCVGSRHLPVAGNVMVHFDSHPDMGIPDNIHAKDFDDVHELYDKLSIESWILPAAYMKVIETIIWICPPWCDQIPEGTHKFSIGVNKFSKNVQVSCPEDYFASDGTSCSEDDLLDKREVTLVVIKLKTLDQNAVYDHQLVTDLLSSKEHYILDIDLDFYSTKNPFLSMYDKSELCSKLKKIYCSDVKRIPECDEDRTKLCMQYSHQRLATIEKLKDLINYLEINRTTDGYTGSGKEFVNAFNDIKFSIEVEYGPEEKIDWLLVHNAGLTCDNDTELPHHISTKEEIENLVIQTEKIIRNIRKNPTIVSVARSSNDDYCPPDQVESIQTEVIQMLERIFGGPEKISVNKFYQ